MKTAELEGPALDWAVGKAGGWHRDYPYSTDWAFGGPIIEREELSVCPASNGGKWMAVDACGTNRRVGPTPLVAAMRCYVASKLGDEVKIPKELL